MRRPSVVGSVLLLLAIHPLMGDGQQNTKPEDQNPGISMRNRLGLPVEETFLVNSDFIASVHYGKDGMPCKVLLKARDPASATATTEDKSNIRTRVKIALEQLVPVAARGKEVESGFVDLNCKPEERCSGSVIKWEAVTIYYWSVRGQPNPYQYATVRWADTKCLLPD